MHPFQRRAFAICIFALAFIFFYEARGQRLVKWVSSETVEAAELAAHFWQNITAGVFVLLIGGLLLFVFRVPIVLPENVERPPRTIPALELAFFALAVGVLIGTAIVSWMFIRQ